MHGWKFKALFPGIITSICSVLVSSQQQPFNTQSGLTGTDIENRILSEEISDFVKNTLSEWGSPGGVSVVVVRKTDLDSSRGGHDGLVWVVETKGYGNADLAGKISITDSSLFSIGSNSKLVTAIATGLLISNESLTPRITWKTKLGSLIPEWQLVDPIAHQESTVLDALSHRTGLPRHDLAYNKDDSIQTLFKRLRNLKPSASFRDIWQYNNIMYCVVSSLPSKLLPSHIPFARYVKEHLFDKLQMHDTTYSYDEVQATGRLVSGLAREHVDPANPFAPGITRVTPYWITTGGEDGNFMAGAGGVISSGKDLAIWLQMLLLDGVHPSTNETIVPKAVLDTISTGYSIPMGRSQFPEVSPVVYGAGQIRLSYRGYEMITHNGYVTGHHSEIRRVPSKGLGIAVLTNDDLYGSYLEQIIGYRILDKLLGLEPVDWNGRFKKTIQEKAFQRVTNAHISQPLANLSVPIETLAGIYTNAGYGIVELCAFPIADPATLTPACQSLAKEVDVILPGAIKPNKPTLIGRWNKVWSSHVILSHFNDNLFNISAPISMPTNDSSRPFWAYGLDREEIGTVVAEFALAPVQGFCLSGGAWGAGPAAEPPSGDTLRDRAEIYFEKV